jgi:Tol biopolymer transport system component
MTRLWLLGIILFPGLLVAQRAPVLRQIKVPHSYYYREMYLPQLTTGPSAATWSPDGTELIYSMQGSLWRQKLGSREARQLTSGPGYAYQPDWSPDGRHVAFARYVDDAIHLQLLDLSTGETRALVADGAVNVEPSWSPDGSRVAFVSSSFEGRWHIFIASLNRDATLDTIVRVTEDRLSPLPRYYYSAYEQYLSPTWSADGRELIFVSNRGHIWGSGGFWRMQARPGVEPRELRFEETTWKARPDWSPDGRRVVYSSYLGRQWHQLWLMTADGGDPFQLTYGEGDATAARWSRDGRRIAYISNESGNTELQVVSVPGGAVERVVAEKRIYREPVGRLRLTVVDGAGRSLPARVSITAADGRSFAPDDVWQHADDAFDRKQRAFEYGYFHTRGSSSVTAPAGQVELEVSRGPEYGVFRRSLTLAADSSRILRVVLNRIANLPATGWYSADLHVHMNYGGTYRNTPAYLAQQARAEDVHLIENLIVNKEGRVPDVGYFTGRPDPVSTASTLIVHDQEYHTSFWGHTGLLGLTRNLILPGYSAYANTAAASPDPANAQVFDQAHAQRALTGYVHPFDSDPDPADTSRALTNELPVDVALGKVDYYEAVGFVDDYAATAKVWYRLLNCGFQLPTGAGTDAMANFASLRGPVGMNRVFAKLTGPFTHQRWLAALKAGRTFATNGPLLGFTLNGRDPGSELALRPRDQQVVAAVSLKSNVPVDSLEIVRNGVVIATVPLSGDRTSASARITLPVRGSGWYLLRARGNGPVYPVLDVYPYATTSPIYVTVARQPIRSPRDANYFIAWINRLEAAANAHGDWNTEAEKREVLRLMGKAKEEFQARGGSL